MISETIKPNFHTFFCDPLQKKRQNKAKNNRNPLSLDNLRV